MFTLKRRESKTKRTRRKRDERKTKDTAVRTLYSETVYRYELISALNEVLYACDPNQSDFNCQCVALDGKKNRIVATCKGTMATTKQTDLPYETLVINYEDVRKIVDKMNAVDNIGAVVELLGTKTKLSKLRFTSDYAKIEVDLVDGDFPAYRELMKPLPNNMFIVYKPIWEKSIYSLIERIPQDQKITITPKSGSVEISPGSIAFNLNININTVSVGVFEPFDVIPGKLLEMLNRIDGDRVHVYRRLGSNMIIITSGDAASKIDIYDVNSVHIIEV